MVTAGTTEALGQQDRLQLLAEKRKWQTEIENKKRQLEDDRRALQHLKSKALRERWLLEGAPSAGPEQDDVRRQLEQDEAKTRSLEDTINRLEQELVGLESGAVCQTIKPTAVTSGSVKAVEVKGHGSRQQDRPAAACQVVQAFAEVKVQKSPRMNKPREATEEMKRAMYSVEIKVERDRLTGETRVLSTHTKLPVDLHQGVKVYEDERKVVHEMNGEDAVLLSSSEVDELIHKADEASMMSQTIATVTSLPTAEEQEEAGPEPPGPPEPPQGSVEITGLEAEPEGEPGVAEASEEKPVTMVFMGYQSVEDEDQTKRVLGLQGTVKAELVLIDDADGKTSPGEAKQEEAETDAPPPSATTPPQSASTPPPASTAPPPASTAPPPVSKPPAAAAAVMVTPAAASNGETRETEGTVQIKKDKQPCKCCSIM
ncbi:paralemmin 1a [Scomber japonicus]|uniref:paralemmin 1a n=1 Tax=Scomber japonicus TaxID=13676 RepID=UPI0023061713|nr:paralemmin 1a [Scomber japonicus]